MTPSQGWPSGSTISMPGGGSVKWPPIFPPGAIQGATRLRRNPRRSDFVNGRSTMRFVIAVPPPQSFAVPCVGRGAGSLLALAVATGCSVYNTNSGYQKYRDDLLENGVEMML
jgi:hypothetical protein